MTAQSGKTRVPVLLLLCLLALVVVAGFILLKPKSVGLNKEVTKETASPSPTATQNPTNQTVVPQGGSVNGPVGRNALRAYAGPNAGEITLEWQRYFPDGENYSIHYGTKSNEYPFAVSNIGYISTYIVTGLTPGTKYYFVLEDIRVGAVSAGWDGEVSMVAPSGPVAVVVTAGPVGRNLLTVKPGPKKGEASLSWTRYYLDTEKYNIVYGTTPGVYSYGLLNAIDTTPQDNTYSYVIGDLNSGTRYYFALVPQRSGQGTYVTTEVSVVAP